MPQWGANTVDSSKPKDKFLLDKSANVFATDAGWVMRWPWTDELLVTVDQLTAKLGVANAMQIMIPTYTTVYTNTASQSLTAEILFAEALAVTGTPTLHMISAAGAADVVLSYNAAASLLTQGVVVFDNTNFSLAAAGYGGDTLVINASSTVSGWTGITEVADANAVHSGIPAGYSNSVSVYQAIPVLTLTPNFGSAFDSTGQYVGFALKFNQALTLTTIPTLLAIGTAPAVNLTLTYTATGSNVAAGNLVFKSAVQDYSALVANAVYTINALSTTTGFTGIKNALGGVASITVPDAIGNTFTVMQYEPFQTTLLAGANAVDSTAQTVSFSLVFDRVVTVNTVVLPTIVAISNGVSANLVLTYASGTGTSTLVFSNTGRDFSALTTNEAFFVNASSTIANFSSIANGGVGSTATGITAAANSVSVKYDKPALSSITPGAQITNAAAQVISFSLVFDRAVTVGAPSPTMVAVSNGALANVTLTYASGTGTNTLVFSSPAENYAAVITTGDQSFFANGSSVIANFSSIANTGVASTLTAIDNALAQHVSLVSA